MNLGEKKCVSILIRLDGLFLNFFYMWCVKYDISILCYQKNCLCQTKLKLFQTCGYQLKIMMLFELELWLGGE